jgi:hypothetical protein
MVPLIWLVLIETALIKLFGEKFGFTTQEWSVFLTIAISGVLCATLQFNTPSIFWGGTMETWLRSFQQTFYIFPYGIQNGYSFPAAWHPTDINIVNTMLEGGNAVPWGIWIPYVGYWIVNLIPFWLSVSFLMLIFRKPFVETEKLTYPHTIAQFELIKMSKKTG